MEVMSSSWVKRFGGSNAVLPHESHPDIALGNQQVKNLGQKCKYTVFMES